MTINDLIDALTDARYELGGDAHVRIGHQPSWPLCEVVDAVRVLAAEEVEMPPEELSPEEEAERAEQMLDDQRRNPRVCWIVAGGHPPPPESPYAPEGLWDRDWR